MKTSYGIILFIFIFSLLSTATNELGIFNYSAVETGVTDDDITEITDQAKSSTSVNGVQTEGEEFSIFTGAMMVIKTLKVVVLSILKTIVIAPTLINYGVPLVIASIFQAITSYIEYIALTEYLSGRRVVQ